MDGSRNMDVVGGEKEIHMSIRSDARRVQRATGLSYQWCHQELKKSKSLEERKRRVNTLIAIYGKLDRIVEVDADKQDGGGVWM